MGPEKHLLPIAFAGGIDTKTDPKQVIAGKLLDLRNAIFQQTGAINRRWGYKQLGQSIIGSGGQTISSCYAIDSFNEELLLFDGQKAYAYIQANDAWASRGSIISLIQTNQQIIAGNYQQLSPDFATLGGIEVYAWEDSRGGIRYSVFDAASGSIVVADQPLYAGALSTDIRPKCIAWQGKIYVFYGTAAGTVNFVTISPGLPAQQPGPPNLLLGQLLTPVQYDIAVSATQLGVVSYNNVVSGGFTNTQLSIYTSTLSSFVTVNATPYNVGAPTAPVNVSVDGGGNFWVLTPFLRVGSATPNAAVMNVISPAGTAVSPPGLLGVFSFSNGSTIASLAGAPYADAASHFGYSIRIFAEVQGSNPSNNVIYTQNVSGNANLVGAAPVFLRGVGLASKPFVYNGQTYLNVAFQSPQQSTYFTVDINGNVVGKVFAGQCGGLIAASDNMLPECPAVAPGIFKYANLVKSVANTESGVVLALLGVNATKLDFADTNHFLSAAINKDLYTVGGILQAYDGAAYVEHGFHLYPEGITANPLGTGGLMGPGIYNYCVTYEWNNNNDQTDISTPSLALAVTVGAGGTGSVQLTIPTLRLSKKANVKIVVYRTQASGTTLYRVSSAAVPFYNNPAVDSLVFTDTLADASIIANGAMYTQPLATTATNGANPVCPNSAPPACSLIATYANRVFLAGLDDPYTLWYSQEALANAPMQFSNLLSLRTDPDGGPITALVRMDDKLVVFKSNAIFILIGQGPAPNGDQNDFGSPGLVQVPSGQIGCLNQNTIASTPLGILFQSSNGIWLLDRGLNVSYKGAPVEKYNALGISSATLVPNQWVIFTTSQSGTALVYDYYYDQWSTFTNHAAVDSVLYLGGGNLFTWANPAGQVFLQTPTTFTDAGQAIPFYLKTAKFSLGDVQGYQRVYHLMLLGQYKGTHTLNVAASFDYDDQWTALATINADQTLGLSTFGSGSPFGADSPFGGAAPAQTVYQFRVDVLRKCQTMGIEIWDTMAAPGNEGFSLSQLGLVVGVKKAPFRVPATKQFGAL